MSLALTVGSFDGLHVGHRAVLAALRRRAAGAGLEAGVVTFEPHPLEVLRGTAGGPPLLTERAEKLALLAELGVDRVHLLAFTSRFAALGPREFVRDLLVADMGCRLLVVGEDHRFGHARMGGTAELHELAPELGLELEVVPPVVVGGEPASSTRARAAVVAGDLDLARRLLGRSYGVLAPVVRGAGRGTALGVPTVNLALGSRKAMPPQGIYACRAGVAGRWAPAAAHWGGRPTFGEPAPVLEAHLLDETGDLYGAWVELEFIAKLRDVERFDGPEALTRAMAEDLERTREIVGAGVSPFEGIEPQREER